MNSTGIDLVLEEEEGPCCLSMVTLQSPLAIQLCRVAAIAQTFSQVLSKSLSESQFLELESLLEVQAIGRVTLRDRNPIDARCVDPDFTPDLSQLNPDFTPDLSQLNPNSTPDLTQLNPDFTPGLSIDARCTDRESMLFNFLFKMEHLPDFDMRYASCTAAEFVYVCSCREVLAVPSAVFIGRFPNLSQLQLQR